MGGNRRPLADARGAECRTDDAEPAQYGGMPPVPPLLVGLLAGHIDAEAM